jgi:hypothetical protein
LKRLFLLLALPIALTLAPLPAAAAFVFRVGDKVYVDGKEYTLEEWQRIRGNTDAAEPPVTKGPATQAVPAAPGGARAAVCTSAIYYDEFPNEDERFNCSLGLGSLTREQILQNGWKVDFVEKIPPIPGQPERSPRGLPLHLYKLVISR